MKINGVEVEFDLTSPTDVARYGAACARMERGAAALETPGGGEGFLERYTALLNAQLRLFGGFLDEAFGGGTAEKLLGGNPSLRKVKEVERAVQKAFAQQGAAAKAALKDYAPVTE